MDFNNKESIRNTVRKNYAMIAIAGNNEGCCSSDKTSCSKSRNMDDIYNAIKLGYTPEEINKAPDGSNMGLGCGNPQLSASLKEGDTVLDLGSGAGFDCFIVSQKVGSSGHVIGVDMTPEMIEKSRNLAFKMGFKNVEFRLGEIENLPVTDESIDVIISNCVINLSPEKDIVFREAFRVLKPGGKLSISDIVSINKLPDAVKNDISMYTGCVSGALTADELKEVLIKTGFKHVNIKPIHQSNIQNWSDKINLGDYIVSASIEANKPSKFEKLNNMITNV